MKNKFNKFNIKKYIIHILLFIIILYILYLLYSIFNKYNKYNELFVNITSENNQNIDKTISNIIIPESLTENKLPHVNDISKYQITKNINDKSTMIFPSLFNFPYKNYIGKLSFYRIDKLTEIPEFTLDNIRLFISNFNTLNNYLFYVSLKKVGQHLNQPIYDLAVMDFNTGNMKFIQSNNDFNGTVITINSHYQIIYNDIKTFDVIPRNNIAFQGVIQSAQEDLISIKANPKGKYYIKFIQDTSIQLNNYKNDIKSTNSGLYRNYNITM